jgi:hypothetical protein
MRIHTLLRAIIDINSTQNAPRDNLIIKVVEFARSLARLLLSAQTYRRAKEKVEREKADACATSPWCWLRCVLLCAPDHFSLLIIKNMLSDFLMQAEEETRAAVSYTRGGGALASLFLSLSHSANEVAANGV